MDGIPDIKIQQHVGGDNYISVTSGFLCVDLRKFYRPYNAKNDGEIKPTRKGVTLRLDEWTNLCFLVNTIMTTYPSLKNVQPCYYDHDDMNSIACLECKECNPFLNLNQQPMT